MNFIVTKLDWSDSAREAAAQARKGLGGGSNESVLGGGQKLQELKKEALKYKDVNAFVNKNLGKSGTFHHNGRLFSVDVANEYIKKNNVSPMVMPKDIYSQSRIDGVTSVGILEGGRAPDLSIPGIAAEQTRQDGSKGYLLIDGWNRAKLALDTGKELKAYPVPWDKVNYRSIWESAHK